MWPYWYIAKCQSLTVLLNSPFLDGNSCLDHCDSTSKISQNHPLWFTSTTTPWYTLSPGLHTATAFWLLSLPLIPFSLYINKARNLYKSNDSTNMCLGKVVSVTVNYFVVLTAEQRRVPDGVFFSLHFTVGVCWRTSKCFRHCNSGVVQTMVSGQAEAHESGWSRGDSQRQQQKWIQVPLMYHIWSITVKSCRAMHQTPGKGPGLLEKGAFMLHA